MALLYLFKWFALNALDLEGSLQTVSLINWVLPLTLAITRTREGAK